MAINFFLTDAGRNALNKVGDVASFGGELTHLAVGTGKFDASVEAKNLTSLKNELARFSLNGGGVDTETGTLRFVMSIEPDYGKGCIYPNWSERNRGWKRY
nr:hypothetical protein [Acinetobacter pittii]